MKRTVILVMSFIFHVQIYAMEDFEETIRPKDAAEALEKALGKLALLESRIKLFEGKADLLFYIEERNRTQIIIDTLKKNLAESNAQN